MKVLAIETSSTAGGVAVVDASGVRFEESFETARRETGPLFSILERAVAACGNPDRVVAGTGPGSYNGIRTAVAAASGLRLACGCEAVGVSSWLAVDADSGAYAVAGDARGGVFAWAEIENREFRVAPELCAPEELRQRIAVSRVPVYSTMHDFPEFLPARFSAVLLARLASDLDPSAHPPVPLYLKEPHITRRKAD